MERLTVHPKNPKQAKGKKKPIKVVYISSPMKFKTSASEFRALVQELTGKDSDIADNMAKYPMIESTDQSLEAIEFGCEAAYDPGLVRSNPSLGLSAELYKSVASPFETFDEAFSNQMLQNFPGFMPPSHFYDPQGGAFRNFNEL